MADWRRVRQTLPELGACLVLRARSASLRHGDWRCETLELLYDHAIRTECPIVAVALLRLPLMRHPKAPRNMPVPIADRLLHGHSFDFILKFPGRVVWIWC